ncbi:MAG: stage II sporulation protein R [Clostridia bacterium]|nr:stage II sporulation protein R [Clostridia bacterium]
MSRWCKALAGGLLLTMVVQFFAFSAVCEDIRGDVLRVHILANSDSEEDQTLKLKVRDAVLAVGEGVLDGVVSRDEAKARLQQALPTLQAAAQQCVYDNGFTDTVTAQTVNMYFTTRTYESGTYPAGYYDAVRFTIGEGKGKNWWCVLYPPMCLSAAMDTSSLSPSENAVIQNGQRYLVRFKVVEWLQECMSFFKR